MTRAPSRCRACEAKQRTIQRLTSWLRSARADLKRLGRPRRFKAPPRVVDAIQDRGKAGEPVEETAKDFGASVAVVRRIQAGQR